MPNKNDKPITATEKVSNAVVNVILAVLVGLFIYGWLTDCSNVSGYQNSSNGCTIGTTKSK